MNPVLRRDLRRLTADRERVAQEFHTVISRGEEVLDHAHRVAHDIEEKVRHMLQADGQGNGSHHSNGHKEKDALATAGLIQPPGQ